MVSQLSTGLMDRKKDLLLDPNLELLSHYSVQLGKAKLKKWAKFLSLWSSGELPITSSWDFSNLTFLR